MSQSAIKRAHPAYAGRERVKGWHTFQKKFCFMVYCDFERGGSPNEHFQSTPLVGREVATGVLCVRSW